jgi:hypothetical protein
MRVHSSFFRQGIYRRSETPAPGTDPETRLGFAETPRVRFTEALLRLLASDGSNVAAPRLRRAYGPLRPWVGARTIVPLRRGTVVIRRWGAKWPPNGNHVIGSEQISDDSRFPELPYS